MWGKVIVYCHKRGITNSFSKSLYCTAYHSKVINKEGVLKCFISSNNGIIVAMSLLDLGVDTLSVDTVLHVRALKSLEDYTQKNRKAGCNKRVSQAVIFFSNRINVLFLVL